MSRVRQEELATSGGRGMPPRRRFDYGGGEEPTTTGAAAGCRCRSCAVVALADCVALGCCPCAVVSLVRAPIAVGRRCVGGGRLRRRRRRLLRQKRVHDDVDDAVRDKSAKPDLGFGGVILETMATGDGGKEEAGRAAEAEAELAWLEEMFQMGHWGFGRVSLSLETP